MATILYFKESKVKVFKQLLEASSELTDEQREFLEANDITSYTVNENGEIDVDGEVWIKNKIDKFPVQFGVVTGDFLCSDNQLTSLKGAPQTVGGDFDCYNNQLTSLDGAPKSVGGSAYVFNNQITSLRGIHKHIKKINRTLNFRNNPIKDSILGLLLIEDVIQLTGLKPEVSKIINKHMGKGRAGVMEAQKELIEAGYPELAKL